MTTRALRNDPTSTRDYRESPYNHPAVDNIHDCIIPQSSSCCQAMNRLPAMAIASVTLSLSMSMPYVSRTQTRVQCFLNNRLAFVYHALDLSGFASTMACFSGFVRGGF